MGAYVERFLRPKLWLTDDDTITVDGSEFRLRVWRSKHRIPVVLASSVLEQPPPSQFTVKLANRAWRDYLHYDPDPFDYYEAQPYHHLAGMDGGWTGDCGGVLLLGYQFAWSGQKDRARVIGAYSRTMHVAALEDVLGSKIEL